MPIDPSQKCFFYQRPQYARPSFYNRVSPKKNGNLFIKIPHAPQVAFKTPPVYENGICTPGFHLLIQCRIIYSPEMMRAGLCSNIFYKAVIISCQQRNIPFDDFTETRIIFIC